MKAAVLKDANKIERCDVDLPVPAEGQVRVRVRYTGVCGSDVPRALEGKVHAFPLILGHEFSGYVDEVGPGVDGGLVGKLVSGIPLQPCGECENCGEGLFSLCGRYGFTGSRSAGSMAEYVVVPEENVYCVAEGVTEMCAAFFEPATVALHGIELAGVRPGASAIVLGAGTIGILLAQALEGYGVDNVVATVRKERNMATAKAAQLDKVVLTSAEGWQQEAFSLAGRTGFDYVFDTAGTPETILDAFEMAGPRATVCFVGTPKKDVSFTVPQWENLNRKELRVIGSWMSYSAPWPGAEWEKASDFFARGILRIADEMIDAVYPLSQVGEAFRRYAEPDGVHGKIMIDSGRE